MLKGLKLAAVVATLFSMPALAEMNGTLRIGVLNDMSSVYADFQGPGSVLAAQLALEDFAKQSKRKVEVISADEKNKVAIGSGAGTALLTGAKCSPIFVHWTYDTWAHGHALARGVLATGGKSWFFITADYAFGYDLEKQASDEVSASGGKILGGVRHPLGVNDLASFILPAQASNADVVALANAGGDTVNTIKQAAEFKIAPKQKIVSLIFDLQSVPAIGLQAAQGLTALNAWYWDMNDQSRAWSKRYQERHPKKMMPNHMQAGVYAGVLHYLKAVEKVGSPADGRAVVAAMKAMPTDDPLFGKGTIREDGRKIHPMYLLQVKTPAESKSEWDV